MCSPGLVYQLHKFVRNQGSSFWLLLVLKLSIWFIYFAKMSGSLSILSTFQEERQKATEHMLATSTIFRSFTPQLLLAFHSRVLVRVSTFFPSAKEPGISGFFQSLHVVTHNKIVFLSSIQFSLSVVSDSLQSHGLQHARLTCPSPVPKICSNWCPLSLWCHLTISSSVILLSFCLQSFPASVSFPVNQFFTSGDQSIGASISASTFQWIFRTDLLQDWLVWSPCCPRDSQGSSSTPQFKSISSSVLSFLHGPTLTSYMTTGKIIGLTIWTFVDKVMSLLFNMLSRLGYQDPFNLSMLSLTTKFWSYHNWKRHIYPSLLKHYLQ